MGPVKVLKKIWIMKQAFPPPGGWRTSGGQIVCAPTAEFQSKLGEQDQDAENGATNPVQVAKSSIKNLKSTPIWRTNGYG